MLHAPCKPDETHLHLTSINTFALKELLIETKICSKISVSSYLNSDMGRSCTIYYHKELKVPETKSCYLANLVKLINILTSINTFVIKELLSCQPRVTVTSCFV